MPFGSSLLVRNLRVRVHEGRQDLSTWRSTRGLPERSKGIRSKADPEIVADIDHKLSREEVPVCLL